MDFRVSAVQLPIIIKFLDALCKALQVNSETYN